MLMNYYMLLYYLFMGIIAYAFKSTLLYFCFSQIMAISQEFIIRASIHAVKETNFYQRHSPAISEEFEWKGAWLAAFLRFAAGILGWFVAYGTTWIYCKRKGLRVGRGGCRLI